LFEVALANETGNGAVVDHSLEVKPSQLCADLLVGRVAENIAHGGREDIGNAFEDIVFRVAVIDALDVLRRLVVKGQIGFQCEGFVRVEALYGFGVSLDDLFGEFGICIE
jgi:hypothetical protein